MSRYQLNEQMTVKYSDRLEKEIVSQVQIGPVQQRKCTDIVCLILFILFLLTFIIFLAYFLANGGTYISELKNTYSVQQSQRGMGPTFVKQVGTIVGMIVFSIILSVIFIVLCAKFPKCVVYFGIVFTFVCYLAIVILAFAMKQWILAFVVLAIAFVNGILLYCWREQIKIGIALLRASGTFMIQKPSIAVIGIISLFINLLFLVFYIIGWISAYSQTLPQYNSSQSSRDKFSSMMVFFIFMGIYLGYFLYYLMVFVLSTAVAYWYYQEPKHILHGYKTVRKHLGSLALASLIITIVVILRRAAQKQAQDAQNLCLKVVWCLLACIMRCIEGFVQVLNHNSVIVMSVTGQNYLNSAKTTIGLIAHNFPLFWIVSFITDFIQFYSLVICVLAPSVVGGGIIWGSDQINDTAVIGGIIIFLLSWIVTSVILGILYEVLSAVFIMYCFDKKLRLRGFINGNIPQEIKQLFDDVQSKQNFNIVHNNELKPSTQTALKKQIHSKNPSLDNDVNMSKQPVKKTRKRKLNRKQGEAKKIDQKSEDKSDIADGEISMTEQDNHNNYGANDCPVQSKSEKLHPYYLQQSELK